VAGDSGESIRLISGQPLLAQRFELIRVLGSGGTAAVFHVRDSRRGGEEVALKVLSNSAGFDSGSIGRFEAEVAVLRDINHPHIVKAYDFISLGHTVAFTMELVQGTELVRFMRKGSLSYTQLDMIFRQILSALHELHGRGIYHRDLKLENILFSETFGIKLADFGLIKVKKTSRDTKTGVLLGTAQYLPPEYIKGGKYDARSDLYCVGLLLYELLSGKRWLSQCSSKDTIPYLVKRNFKIPYDLSSDVPMWYHRVLRKALAVDPKQRYQTAYEMMLDFCDYTDSQRIKYRALYSEQTEKKPSPRVLLKGAIDLMKEPTALLILGLLMMLLGVLSVISK
jgi:serine/threonine-protein kinase